MTVAVLDLGASHTRVLLFGPDRALLAVERQRSRHRPGPPYAHLDLEPALAFAAESLERLSRECPVEAIVPCSHGSALALLDEGGEPVLPVMDYLAEPPAELRAAYRAIEPPFGEVFAPTNPGALTLGLQLFWQESAFPEPFARVSAILPLAQYLAFRLCGRAVGEVTALGAQTHLWDVPGQRFSSLARQRGWDRLFAPLVPAWEGLGPLAAPLRRPGFRGEGRVLAGIHDSNANYLRYLAAGLGPFTLLSTGTWIIGFDTETQIETLDPTRDAVSNTDLLGRPVASCRFMGGREFEAVAAGAPPEAATVEALEHLIDRQTFALPAFTDSGGPVPGVGGCGRIVGPTPESHEEGATLAALYCALMTDLSLEVVGSRNRVVVDGPFATNPVFTGVLAVLRPDQAVLTSTQSEGTAAGAALLAEMSGPEIPAAPLDLEPAAPLVLRGLQDYRGSWLEEIARGQSSG